MSEHRWTLVVIGMLDERAARALHSIEAPERFERVVELVGQTSLEQVRGPICADCSVHWRDVFAEPDKPWPCGGPRPKAFGGPLLRPEGRKSRQQRRAERTKAVEQFVQTSIAPGATVDTQVRRAIGTAVRRTQVTAKAWDAEPEAVRMTAPTLAFPETVIL